MEKESLIIFTISGLVGLTMACIDKFIYEGNQIFSSFEWVLLGLVAGSFIIFLKGIKNGK